MPVRVTWVHCRTVGSILVNPPAATVLDPGTRRAVDACRRVDARRPPVTYVRVDVAVPSASGAHWGVGGVVALAAVVVDRDKRVP